MSEEQTVQDSGEDKGDVISRLEAVLESKGQTEEPGDEDEVVAETTDEVVEETTDEVIEETQEETETEATESEEVEKDPTEEEEAAEDDDLEQTVTKGFVDIDGEKVSIEEVKLGYLRQADYTKKTQAVAEQRKAAEEELQKLRASLEASSNDPLKGSQQIKNNPYGNIDTIEGIQKKADEINNIVETKELDSISILSLIASGTCIVRFNNRPI